MENKNMVSNKKMFRIAITILVVIAAVISVYMIFFRPRKISEFCGGDVDKFQSVYIIDGNTGDSAKLGKEDYESVYNILNEITYKPIYDKQKVGWSYRIQITVDDKMTDIVFSSSKCEINGKQYAVSGKNYEQQLANLYERTKDVYLNESY